MQTKEEFFLYILNSVDAHFNINISSRSKLLLTEKTKKINVVYFMKDGEIYMEQDEKNGYLWCNYGRIWSVFETKYSMNYQQIQRFIKHMVEKHFKSRDLTLLPPETKFYSGWKNISNRGI